MLHAIELILRISFWIGLIGLVIGMIWPWVALFWGDHKPRIRVLRTYGVLFLLSWLGLILLASSN